MPEYWQFPTVSMGLGPLMAIYQARFLKYLDARGLADTTDRHVWAFLGDGEMDEPESLGAISLAAREKLDNLIFVVNCNLQRLDGPVRGNGKIIQELEGVFRGAGWNVIKVIWGSGWDPLLGRGQDRAAAPAHGGVRRRRVPGLQVQGRRLRSPALLRQVPRAAGHGRATCPTTRSGRSRRGGHDPQQGLRRLPGRGGVTTGQPTVILAKTVKGYGMGEAGEGQNITHQQKKMGENVLRAFRDRFGIVDLPDERIAEVPFLRFAEDSRGAGVPAASDGRRWAGRLPARRERSSQTLPVPELSAFDAQLKGDRGSRRSPRRWRSCGS